MTKQIVLSEAGELALIAREIEASGEDVVLTRDGAPVVRMTAVHHPTIDAARRRVAIEQLIAARDRMAREYPQTADPLSWEDLRKSLREDDDAAEPEK